MGIVPYLGSKEKRVEVMVLDNEENTEIIFDGELVTQRCTEGISNDSGTISLTFSPSFSRALIAYRADRENEKDTKVFFRTTAIAMKLYLLAQFATINAGMGGIFSDDILLEDLLEISKRIEDRITERM